MPTLFMNDCICASKNEFKSLVEKMCSSYHFLLTETERMDNISSKKVIELIRLLNDYSFRRSESASLITIIFDKKEQLSDEERIKYSIDFINCAFSDQMVLVCFCQQKISLLIINASHTGETDMLSLNKLRKINDLIARKYSFESYQTQQQDRLLETIINALKEPSKFQSVLNLNGWRIEMIDSSIRFSKGRTSISAESIIEYGKLNPEVMSLFISSAYKVF